MHNTKTTGLFVPFSCLSKRERRWCAGKIWFRFRIHLSQVHLTAPERTGPDRQATLPVSERERHEWTIWSYCVDFGTERSKVYICASGRHDDGKWLPKRHQRKMFPKNEILFQSKTITQTVKWIPIQMNGLKKHICEVFTFIFTSSPLHNSVNNWMLIQGLVVHERQMWVILMY